MEYLKKYNNFVSEALSLKKAKKFTKLFNKERYEALFQKMKEKYSGDRNAYRIYLPLITEKRDNPIENEIIAFLAEKEYDVIDYFKGICKFHTAKNPTKIGQVLTRAGADALMKKFVEDPERKKGVSEDLMVVISRHPYDIAGSDTDRNWTNCMTMAMSKKDPRMKILFKRKKEIEKALKETEGDKEVASKLTKELQKIQYEIRDRTEEGENTRFLPQEVKQGSLISYLIKKDDKNINEPLAVLNIKPYKGKKGEIYLNVCQNSYGIRNEDFHNTVKAFIDEANEGKTGSYELMPHVYSDGDVPKIYTGDRSLKDVFKEYDKDDDQDDDHYYNGEDDEDEDDDHGGDYYGEYYNRGDVEDCRFDYIFLTSLEGIERIKDTTLLSLTNNRLKDLKGVEKLKNLTQLFFNNNQIENAENIYGLKQLVQLLCENNKLTELKLDNFKELTQLYVSQNKLTTLDLSKTKKLQTLVCRQNKLTELIGLKKSIALTQIHCENNELTNLKDIDRVVNLNYLNCNNNQITNIKDLDRMLNLRTLYCNNNKLVNLKGLEDLPNLQVIGYANNPLKCPLQAQVVDKFGDQYTDETKAYFNTYEFQKEFIEKYKENLKRLSDLTIIDGFVFENRIKEEYKELLDKYQSKGISKKYKKAESQKSKDEAWKLCELINDIRQDYYDNNEENEDEDWRDGDEVIRYLDELEKLGYQYDEDDWEVYRD